MIVVIFCIVAIVAAAHAVWWLAGIMLLGALMLGTAEFLDDERRAADEAAQRRAVAELARREVKR